MINLVSETRFKFVKICLGSSFAIGLNMYSQCCQFLQVCQDMRLPYEVSIDFWQYKVEVEVDM